MSQQQSQKRGVRSEAQKTERARAGYDSMPPSNAVAGAFGNSEPDRATGQDVALKQSAKNTRKEDHDQ